MHKNYDFCWFWFDFAGEEALVCDDEDEVVHVKAQQVPLLGGDDNGETFDQKPGDAGWEEQWAQPCHHNQSFVVFPHFCLLRLVPQQFMLLSVGSSNRW